MAHTTHYPSGPTSYPPMGQQGLHGNPTVQPAQYGGPPGSVPVQQQHVPMAVQVMAPPVQRLTKRSNAGYARALGILHGIIMILCFLSIILEAVSASYLYGIWADAQARRRLIAGSSGNIRYSYSVNPVTIFLPGVWIGILGLIFSGVGVFHVRASVKKSLTIASLVLSIIYCVVLIVQLGSSAALIVYSRGCINDYNYSLYYSSSYTGCGDERYWSVYGMQATLLTLALVQGVVAIVASALGCRLVCCSAKTRPVGQPGQSVVYTPPGGAPVHVQASTTAHAATPQGMVQVYGPPSSGSAAASQLLVADGSQAQPRSTSEPTPLDAKDSYGYQKLGADE